MENPDHLSPSSASLRPSQTTLTGHRQRQIPRWIWGLAWGLGWAFSLNIVADGPVFLQVESALQRQVWRWRGPQEPSPDIVIVAIDGQLEGEETSPLPDFALERANFAGLTTRLFEEGNARAVVLNLPGSFVVPQSLGDEDLDRPLRQVVQQYADRLVLAIRTSASFQQEEMPILNHFLPFSSMSLQYEVPPEDVQGFVQFETDRLGIVRQIQVEEEMVRRDSLRLQWFRSVEGLTLAKTYPERFQTWMARTGTTLFNPLGPVGSIPRIAIERICPPSLQMGCTGPSSDAVIEQVENKIVLVGFVEGSPERHPVRTPDGYQLSAVELQAQMLSNLVRGETVRRLSWGVQTLVAIAAGVGAGLVMTVALPHNHLPSQSSRMMGTLSMRGGAVVLGLGSYWGVGMMLMWTGMWLWPLSLPVMVGGSTAICTVLTVVLLSNRDRLQAQQRELEILRQAEQEAVIHQARKLLYRVATDIHDRELQELKLAMDELEVLQLDNPKLDVDPLLDQLQGIGTGIRRQLNDARTLATKLGISPSLKEGLHCGIEEHLNDLVTNGTLALAIKRHLPALQEPHTSDWFDAREDIYRFAREAIANVIQHVHPPRGTATYLLISLSQEGSHCKLEVINDGIEVMPPKKGGYGTKAMNTIARQLPNGQWGRQHTDDGRTLVTLTWDLPVGG